jgi:hypothetical protein
MRILFDQGVPVPLRRAFPAHTVSTAYEEGWAELANGALLQQAASKFDVFITTDKNLRFQQNVGDLPLAIIVLPTTTWATVQQNQGSIVAALSEARPGEITALDWR